jgi:kynurenine formamidase
LVAALPVRRRCRNGNKEPGMRHDFRSKAAAWLIALGLALTAVIDTSGQRQGGAPPVDPAARATLKQFEEWMATLSNWGRWGPGDELGAMNLVTAAKRTQAAALVKTGDAVSLAHPLLAEKAADAPNPYVLMPRRQDNTGYAFDREEIDFHGYTFSHLDALCHVSYNGKLYNGLAFTEVVSQTDGCAKLGITNLRDRIVTRGVLVDIPRLRGVPYLEPGAHVYREDIQAWEQKANVKVGAGDAIFLRTGRWARRASAGPFMNVAGWDVSVIPFFKERDIALIGSDGVQDVGTFPAALPIHKFAIVALGANLFDNLDLETLSETAARLNRWEFMLVAGPTPVTHGTGSPINPIAVF